MILCEDLYLCEDPDPVEPAADVVAEEPVEPVEPAAEPAAPAENEADFYTTVEAAVWNEDDPLDESALKGLSVDEIKALPMAARMVLKGLLSERKGWQADAEKAKTEAIDAAKAERAETEKLRAEVERKQLAYSKAVANPEVIDRLRATIAAKPAVVAPNDPKALEAAIKAAAAEAQLEAMGPAAAEYDRSAREQSANAIFESAGMNRRDATDNKAVNDRMRQMFGRPNMTGDQFKAHIGALTAAAKANGGRTPTEIAVDIEAANRKAAADASRKQDESAARIAGARTMTTSRPAVTPQKTDKQYVEEIMARIGDDPEAWDVEYNTNQKFREATLRLAS